MSVVVYITMIVFVHFVLFLRLIDDCTFLEANTRSRFYAAVMVNGV